MSNCCLTPSNNEPHAYYKFDDMHIHVHVVILAHLSDQKPFPNFYLVHLPVVTTGNNFFFLFVEKVFSSQTIGSFDEANFNLWMGI